METQNILITNPAHPLSGFLKAYLTDRGYQVRLCEAPEEADYAGITALVCLPGDIPGIPLADLTEEAILRACETSYKSMLLYAKNAAAAMIQADVPGSILFVTDMDGIRSGKHDLLSGAIHAALHRSTESLALQLAPHAIRINCLAPGRISYAGICNRSNGQKSEACPKNIIDPIPGYTRTPMGRPGTPAEICAAILWLTGPGSAYITGTTQKCDGANTLAGMPEGAEGYGWDKERNLAQ